MTIGIGIIGYAGAASRLHLPVLTRLPGVRVTAIAGTTREALHAVADRYAIPGRYLDYRTLLRDPSVDAVAVCVPPVLHEVIGLAALEAKKHVFMEKPLALSLEQCARLVHAADSAPVTTMVGFHLRWHRLVQEAQKRIASGRLGTVELLRTVFTSGILRRAPKIVRAQEPHNCVACHVSPWARQRSRLLRTLLSFDTARHRHIYPNPYLKAECCCAERSGLAGYLLQRLWAPVVPLRAAPDLGPLGLEPPDLTTPECVRFAGPSKPD